MALKGDLKTLSLPSLFQIIETERKTGLLYINTESFQRQVYLRKGEIVFLTSDDPRDFLGHFLVRSGIVSEDTLAKTFLAQKFRPELIGQIFRKITEMTEPALKRQLMRKLEDSVYQLFLLEHADFDLDEDAVNFDDLPIVCELPIRRILFEGIKRLDEYRKYKVLFPDENQTFKVHREKLAPEVTLTHDAGKMLDDLEKGLSIAELCLNFHTYEYTILQIMEFLLKSGVISKAAVKLVEKPKLVQSMDGFAVLMEVAQKAEEESEYQQAVEVYADLLKLDPDNQNVRERYRDTQQRLADNLTKTVLPKSSIPLIANAKNLSGKGFSPEDGFVLSRINGLWTINEIITVIPLPEPQVLLILKRFLDEGVIKLKA